MATTVSVGSISPVLVSTAGSVNDRLTVTFPTAPRSTGTIYYGTTAKVSSSNNTGSLAPGGTLTMDRQQFYFIAALDANGKNASGLISYFPPVFEEQPLIPGALVRLNGSAIETSTDHGTTWVAAQTPGAATTIYQAVDSLSGAPRSVTDWGALINTALAAGTRRFIFGPYDYPFTTMINGRPLQGIVFEGAAGLDWYEPGRTDTFGNETGHTRLIWNGTGTGYALDMSSAATGTNGNTGFCMSDIALIYSSSSYTGRLVNCRNATMLAINRCYFGASSGSAAASTPSAVAAFQLDGINTIDFQDCTFGPEFTSAAVRGRETPAAGTANYSNVVHFLTCTFEGPAICNPGLDWVLDHCVFELNQASAMTAITTDFTYTGDSIVITLANCAYWDSANASSKVVLAPAGNTWDFTAINCNDHNTATSIAKLYDFQCNGAVRIWGGGTSNIVDVGDATTASHAKELVEICGFQARSTSTKSLITNLNTGHIVVNFSGNGGGSNLLGNSAQQVTLAHERAIGVDEPTIAAHAGVTNHSFTVIGNDLCGVIIISNTAGGAGPTGLLADVTITSPPSSPAAGASAASTHRRLPIVQVFPFLADDGGSFYATPAASAYYTAQPYAYAKSLAAGGSQSAFSIGVVTGIPGSSSIGLGYRVIHI